MSTINIAKGFRMYSPEELREYCLSGVLECNGVDLSDFMEYFLSGWVEKLVDEAKEEAYDEGYEEGKLSTYDDYVSDGVLEKIEKAIKILKEI